MFSGRRDPQWVVKPENQSIYGTIQELFSNAVKLRETYKLERIPSILGYKGFLLQVGKDRACAILGDKTKKLQNVLLQSIPEGIIPNDLLKIIANAIQKGGILRDKIKAADPGLQRSGTKRWAPPAYSKRTRDQWNIAGVQENNNCYNYANDRITDTFAQPGRAGKGNALPWHLTDLIVKVAARADGLKVLIPQPDLHPGLPIIPNTPKTQLVALFVFQIGNIGK